MFIRRAISRRNSPNARATVAGLSAIINTRSPPLAPIFSPMLRIVSSPKNFMIWDLIEPSSLKQAHARPFAP